MGPFPDLIGDQGLVMFKAPGEELLTITKERNDRIIIGAQRIPAMRSPRL